MFQIQYRGDGKTWSAAPNAPERSTLEYARSEFRAHSKTIHPSIDWRIMDLDTLNVYPVAANPPEYLSGSEVKRLWIEEKARNDAYERGFLQGRKSYRDQAEKPYPFSALFHTKPTE